MLVHDLLSRSAERAGDAVAVIEPRRSASYRDLEQHASRVAAALADVGVRPGDRVLLAIDNSITFVACYFGILKAGAIVVPLPTGASNDRLPAALNDCSPVACIVDEATWPAVDAAVDEQKIAAFVVTRDADPAREPCGALHHAGVGGRRADAAAGVASDEDSLAAIIYTSGTTGIPRGVMLSHRNITSNTASIIEYLGLSAADRAMVVLPFYYVYGLSLLHTHIAVGGSLVLDNRFAFPNVVLHAMQEHRVTGFAGVPSTFALLLHKSKLATMSFPALRYVTQAGGPMPAARIEEWRRALPDVPFYVMYGATEASARLTYLPPSELPHRSGSIGRPIPRVEISVVREDGTPALPREVGEFVARGPNISPGYWQCPEETRERFGPEGYRTGDLGYADEDGYLYLVGRKHEMMKVGAHRISAKEIEEVLHQHPAVHEGAVVPHPDDLLGEVPMAHVAIRDGSTATREDIMTFCRTRLADHKVPRHIIFHDTLPKSAAGKIDKRALRLSPSDRDSAATAVVGHDTSARRTHGR